MNQPHISLAAEKIGSLFGLPITNSILLTWVVMGFLLLFAWVIGRNLSLVPSTLQQIAEIIIESLYDLFKSVVGEGNINKFFPILATIFLFIVFANWSGLLPGVGSIGFRKGETEEKITAYNPLIAQRGVAFEKVKNTRENSETMPSETNNEEVEGKFTPLLRGPTADLNTTLAIALISFFSMQYFGLKELGVRYLSRYFNFSNPIMFFVGLLEIVSDLSKIMSFAFRLFGNIFAGEVLLTVIAFLMPLVAPLPFLGLELFVGFIQALVFSLLTAVFLNMATMAHDSHESQ
ncbi:F0F1 ATP synthase subunit A [Candidatus Gottesmanbacteria bacterium]|nr:F0F1 ATP synthase subunit A [Candidatus Gottesmanbacteria bacterium]